MEKQKSPEEIEAARKATYKKISASIKATWQLYKEEYSAKVHAGNSNQKRSESLKKRYQLNPHLLKQQQEIVRAAREAHSQNALLNHEKAFGSDVVSGLYAMHHIEGLTLDDMATRTGYCKVLIRKLLNKMDVPYIRKTNPKVIRTFQEVQRTLWAQPSLIKTLTLKQRTVIEKRFLSEGVIPDLEDVGSEMGITHQGASQLERKALKRLLAIYITHKNPNYRT